MITRDIRTIVVDDEPLARRRLRSLLRRHADFNIVAEASDGFGAVAAVDEHRPDVLILDVAMPGLTGVQVLERIGSQAVPVVVFVTAHHEHAVAAFEHLALDYVLKPIDTDRFERTLSRIRDRLAQRTASALTGEVLRGLTRPAAPVSGRVAYPSQIVLKSTKSIRLLPVAEIDWVTAEGDYVRLHTTRDSYLYRSTLSGLECRLDPNEFVRIHRSTIVRWSRVGELHPYFRGEYLVTLRNGAQLKLSRSYRDRLQELLSDPI